MGNTNIKQNQTRRWITDRDSLHWQPQKQLFLDQTLQAFEPTKAEIGSDCVVEVDPVLELGHARRVQMNLEAAHRVKIVGLDGVGEEAGWEALGLEEVVER